MSRLIHTAWLCLLVGACGGPPVGGKVPQPKTKYVAGAAAATATALTLANPDLAGRKPESPEAKRERPQKRKGSVPEGVLDRLDDKQEADEELPPCPKGSGAGNQTAEKAPRADFVPVVVNENRGEGEAPAAKKKCRDLAVPDVDTSAAPDPDKNAAPDPG